MEEKAAMKQKQWDLRNDLVKQPYIIVVFVVQLTSQSWFDEEWKNAKTLSPGLVREGKRKTGTVLPVVVYVPVTSHQSQNPLSTVNYS